MFYNFAFCFIKIGWSVWSQFYKNLLARQYIRWFSWFCGQTTDRIGTKSQDFWKSIKRAIDWYKGLSNSTQINRTMNFLKNFFQWNNSWKLCKFTFNFFFELPISSHVSWNLFLTSKEAEKKNILIATKCTSTAATPSGAPYGADLFDSFFSLKIKIGKKGFALIGAPNPLEGVTPV